jgi:hypothetical protein
VQHSQKETSGTIFCKSYQILGYADDNSYLRKKNTNCEKTLSLIEQTNKLGSEVNEQKTKIMTVSRNIKKENKIQCNYGNLQF